MDAKRTVDIRDVPEKSPVFQGGAFLLHHILFFRKHIFFFVFHPEAGAFDYDNLTVMQKAVKDGTGDGLVVVEDHGPLAELPVGGDNHASGLVA